MNGSESESLPRLQSLKIKAYHKRSVAIDLAQSECNCSYRGCRHGFELSGAVQVAAVEPDDAHALTYYAYVHYIFTTYNCLSLRLSETSKEIQNSRLSNADIQ